MKRRQFIKNTAACLPAAGVVNLLLGNQRMAEGTAPEGRPNILLIMTDQQTADGMSCSGNPYVKTPTMDSLASNGVSFRRAYVTQPLCMPFRTSLMTGRYPHETGVVTNGRQATTRFPMLGRALADSGYDCGYLGKWHVGVSDRDEKAHGFGLVGRGLDSELPPQAAAFLGKAREKPFFLTVSFVNPHDACQLARGDALPQGKIPAPPPPAKCPPLPQNFVVSTSEPPVIREVQRLHSDFQYPTVGWDEDRWRQYLWGYYRLIEKVDAEVGRVLQALRASGQEQNTLIVFTSDHGDGAAAHRWNQKQILYEESTRVPLLISWKGVTRAGALDARHLVSTGIDLFPTFLDFARVPIPADLAGRSLRPLTFGKEPPIWRDYIVVETEFARNEESSGVTGRMLRTSRYKYIAYNRGQGREQLFDLETDPGEMVNLTGRQSHGTVLKEHRTRLAEWCKSTHDSFPVPAPE